MTKIDKTDNKITVVVQHGTKNAKWLNIDLRFRENNRSKIHTGE